MSAILNLILLGLTQGPELVAAATQAAETVRALFSTEDQATLDKALADAVAARKAADAELEAAVAAHPVA